MLRMVHVTWVAVALALAACGKQAGSGTSAASAPAAATSSAAVAASAPVLLLSPEDLRTVATSGGGGSVITGSVQPEKRADLRAEVAGIVMQLLKDNGEAVKRGDLLVRLDQTSIRDSLSSADASFRASAQAYEQAQRQFERMAKLRETGVVSTQQLEDVEVRRNTAQSDREAARTRMVAARQQLGRTEVRAPFDGIVSDRKVSAGDTAQVGKELLKVVDPNSLRFEGLVSADNIGQVKAGQSVWFRIHGFAERDFAGTVMRVNPSANVTTRQVEVLVSFNDAKQQPDVAGLYAEGRVETRSDASLTLPGATVVREGDNAFAWRVNGAKLQKVAVTLGERDPRSGAFAVKSGLATGDKVLRFPNATLKDGQEVQSEAAKPAMVVEK